MKRSIWNLCLTIILIALLANFAGAFDVETFIANFENKNDQTVLVGQIDSLTIIRGPAEFHLGQGELTLFDFGWDKPSAMYFKGSCRFAYIPPDDIERDQLEKFTKKPMMDIKLDDIFIFFTVPLDLPDTSLFTRKKLDDKLCRYFSDVRRDAFQHLEIYIANKLLADLVSDNEGSFFYADFRVKKLHHYAFCEDPYPFDLYRIFKLRLDRGRRTYDVYASYTPPNIIPPAWQYYPMGINHYVINARLENNGEMKVICGMVFTALKSGEKFLKFRWFHDNKIRSALDADGKPLQIITRDESFRLLEANTEEHGFGLVLNEATVKGDTGYIDIEYDCGVFSDVLGMYYLTGESDWYPKTLLRGDATFEITFDHPDNFHVIVWGNRVESISEGGRKIDKWLIENPVEDISFNVGGYGMLDINGEGIYPVKIYFYDPGQGASIGADIANSRAFFIDLLGPDLFDTLKIVETPYRFSQNSPGLIHLSQDYFTPEDPGGNQLRERAGQVARQWWKHKVGWYDYRDYWIIEALSDYCGIYFAELSNRGASDAVMEDTRRIIFAGEGGGSRGSQAGPITMGYRLDSSKSKDYEAVVRKKGAYIIHMIRFLLHNYKSGSDDLFISLLQDIVGKDNQSNNYLTNDRLLYLLEQRLGDMTWFFDQWVYGIDIPTYTFSYDTEKTSDGQFQVTCHVKQEDVPEDFKMAVPMTVVFEGDQFAHMKYLINQPQMDIQLPLLPMKPKKIDFNTYDAVLCRVKYK